MDQSPSRPAFTLVEVVLYAALATLVVVGLLQIVLTLSSLRRDRWAAMDLQQSVRVSAERVATTIRHAQDLNVPNSLFGTASGVLALTMSGGVLNPTVFSWSGGSVAVREGAGPVYRLTIPDVSIAELRFENRTVTGNPPIVWFRIRGEHPGARDAMEIQTTVTLRR